MTDCTEAISFDARWSTAAGRQRHVLGIARFSREVLAGLTARRPVEIVDDDFPLLHPLEQRWLRRRIARAGAALHFNPGFNGPRSAPVPVVFTVHDLIHLRVPEESSALKDAYYRLVVRPAARRAACIVTVSEHTRATLLEWAGLPEEKVVVVGEGASSAFTPDGPRHDAERPYLLYVGNHKPHKNLSRLLDAYARSAAATELDLIFAGQREPQTDRAVAERGLTGSVHFVAATTDEELAALYRGALGLVFPSLYEGFGLPALEAMACGVPVIASSTTALGELVGGAAIRVEPTDTEAIAHAIDRLTDDADLRRDLRRRGLECASRHMWSETVARVEEVIRRALESDESRTA